jgi:hypothetical protein
VERHRKNRFFYLLDITDAYLSVDSNRLAMILSRLGFGDINEILAFLRKYCLTPQEGLATGAPASPDLFNLYAYSTIDAPLQEYCFKHDLTVTRYLDDITVSARDDTEIPLGNPIGKCKRRAIRNIVNNAGFRISHHKSKVVDLKKGPVVITGIGLELGGRMFLRQGFMRKANRLLRQAIADPLLHHDKVSGAMGVIRSAKPRGSKLTRTDWKIREQYWTFRRQLARAQSQK